VLAASALLGCGSSGDESDRSTTAAPPSGNRTAVARPEPPPPPPVEGDPVRFRASDGRRVTGTFTPAGRRAPAVILLHQVDGGQEQWDPFVPYLHRAGFATLAYDGRGGLDEQQLAREVVGALRFLRGRRDVDPRRLALVGASIGASTTAYAMATAPGRQLRAAVALSPPDSPIVFALQDRDRWHPHDVLYISDRHESSSVDNAFPGSIRSERRIASVPGHGVALLPDAGVRAAILAWLRGRLG
jgi:dipeptidyl aminopeptidase/acylaminoacyl peptidase